MTPLADDVVRCGTYARISKRKKGKADPLDRTPGVKRQQADNVAEAERRGWVVVEQYEDDARSAFSGRPRPGYDRMIDDLKSGHITHVVAWHEDRLLRSMVELEDLVNIVEATHATIVTVTAGDVDLETPEGRFKARIQAAVARKESEDKSRRLRRMHAELRKDGRPNGGARPFGWSSDRVTPDPSEAPIIAEMVERIANGETLTAVADDLNGRGIVTTRGGAWTLTNVRRCVLNGKHAGLLMHDGREVGVGDWEPIVDEATWRRAVHVLNAPDRPKRRTARRYLLVGGLLRCGRCGAIMRSKPHRNRNGEQTPTYTCPPAKAGGCGGASVTADRIEPLVTDAVLDLIESAAFLKALQQRSKSGAAPGESVSEVKARLSMLNRMLGQGAMSEAEYIEAKAEANEALAAAELRSVSDTKAGAARRYAGQAGKLRSAWPELTIDQRQAIIHAVLDHVSIEPVGRNAKGITTAERIADHFVWKA